jgi:hypothetical protein
MRSLRLKIDTALISCSLAILSCRTLDPWVYSLHSRCSSAREALPGRPIESQRGE